MTDTSIRISEEVKRRLELERKEGESYNDAILRLTNTEKWRGFGALADEDGDTHEGMHRVRGQLRDGLGDSDSV